MTEVKSVYKKDLPVKDIIIDKENVRDIEDAKIALGDLVESIKRYGLLHPIMVISKDGKYKIIVGQRRLLAFQELKKDTIPAFIIDVENVGEAKAISLSENWHRKELSYEDTFEAIKYLYKNLSGSKSQKVKEISKMTSISEGEVEKYLADEMIPEEVRKMISQGLIDRKKARDITTAYFYSKEKIIKFAEGVVKNLTPYDQKRAVEIAKKNPKMSIDEVFKLAKESPEIKRLTVEFDMETWNILKFLSEREGKKPSEFVEDSIKDLIKKRGLHGK